MKLLISAVSKYLLGLVMVGALLFLPAGGFDYINGWLFCGLLFVPMLILGVVLFVKSPELLRKRLDSREKEKTQQGVIAWSGLFFLVGFVLAGLDHRFGWSYVPTWVVIAAAVILLISYAFYAEVMRENAFLSRKIEVQQGQYVIDTGLYGIVRHPMYAVTLWLFLSIPLVLGSWYALICFAIYPVLIVIRILNEEKVLTEELPGYAEYRTRVRYRLILWIW